MTAQEKKAEATQLEKSNIGVRTLLGILVHVAIAAYYFGGLNNDIETIKSDAKSTKELVIQESKEHKLRYDQIETEISEIKIRISILEEKLNKK